jgi:hypothetical protein
LHSRDKFDWGNHLALLPSSKANLISADKGLAYELTIISTEVLAFLAKVNKSMLPP